MFTSTSTNSASRKQGSPDKIERLRLAARRAWTPPPRISVPEWADRYRRLAKEAGSTSGRWRTSTVEAARGPMMAVTEPGVHVITVMCCTQLMKTALLESTVGYFAHLDPCPILLVQPKEDAAEQFSKERITPLVKATPALRKLIGTGKTRSAEETLLYKAFPGGFLALVGAGSPDNLARRPVRVTLFDEVDKYPVTREGDPIALGEERTATFGANWLSVRVCSPTVEDESRIAASYAEGDQRRASVECPHCRHRMFPDFFRHVHWPKTEDGQHEWKRARVHCEACGCEWSEGDRLNALGTIRWHQTRPFTCCGARHVPLEDYEREWRAGVADPVGAVWQWWAGDRWAVFRLTCPHCGKLVVDNDHASFQASKLLSPWPKDRPQDIAKKWLDAQGDEDRKQAFHNTQLGAPYRRSAGAAAKPSMLMERREVYGAEVPDGVVVLTAGVDVQSGEAARLVLEVTGWGRDEESWSVLTKVVPGDPNDPPTWEELDKLLVEPMRRADGTELRIEAVCIDSGGHHTQKVYEFCKARIGRKVWAIKGASERSATRAPIWPVRTMKRQTVSKYKPILVGVNAAKDRIAAMLRIPEPGPGYCHFPHDREEWWFEELTAEVLTVDKVDPKRKVWVLKKGRRNEGLDCRVYAYAALKGLEYYGLRLNQRADRLAPPSDPAEPNEDATENAPASASPAPSSMKRQRRGPVRFSL